MLTIHDQEVYWDGSTKKVITGLPLSIRVQYMGTPILRLDGSGYNEDQSEYDIFPVDPVTGYHDTQLLWPSERRGDTSLVQVRRVGGSIYQGSVPEGITGPLTFDDLLSTYGTATIYGWQIVQAGQEPAQAVQVVPINGGIVTPATTTVLGGVKLSHLPTGGGSPFVVLQEDLDATNNVVSDHTTELADHETRISANTATASTAESDASSALVAAGTAQSTANAAQTTANTHASRHAAGGLDPLTPAAIGALPASDPSVTNSRTPTGGAAGSLAGTYPNPTIAAGAITNTEVAAGAAIAKSKLAALAIADADVVTGAAIVPTKLAADQAEAATNDTLSGSSTLLTTLNRIRYSIGQKLTNLFTARGDLIIAGIGGAAQRLGLGAAGKVLTSNGTDALWKSLAPYGTLASRPDVSTQVDQALYYATDVAGGTLYEVQAGIWTQITTGINALPVSHAATHWWNGIDPILLPARHYQTMPTQAQLQAHMDADHAAGVHLVYVLPGGGSVTPLSITTALTFHQGQTLAGQGHDSSKYGTVISIGASGQIIFDQQARLENVYIDHSASATLDALYVSEASSDQKANQIIMRDIEYHGGSYTNGTWAIHFKNPSEWNFNGLKLFPTGNGIFLECTNDYAFNPGDGAAYNVEIRLQHSGTTGVRIAGQQSVTSGGPYNVRIPNDQSWHYLYVTAADLNNQGINFATAGNVGVQIDNCSKVFFFHINLEENQTDFKATGNVGTNINLYSVTGGTGYTVGDVLTFSNAHGGTQAQATVATAPGGVVGTLTWIERGSLYQAGDVLTATGGTGTGAGLTVTSIGGPNVAGIYVFGAYFADAWQVNANVTDAHFYGKCDVDPTGVNVSVISGDMVRTGQGSSVPQMVSPHFVGALGTQLWRGDIYVTNSSGADIANNRLCKWVGTGLIDLMTSTDPAGKFAGVSFSTITNGTSFQITEVGSVSVPCTGAVTAGDYLVVDPSNPGRVISTGTTQSSTQPTVGMSLTTVAGTATITMLIVRIPPAPAVSSYNGPGTFHTGLWYSGAIDTTPSGMTQNVLYGTPIYIPNACTLDTIALEITTAATSCVVRLGLYADSAGVPGTRIADYGTIDAHTGTGVQTIAISQTISTPGVYWLVAVLQGGTGVSVRAVTRGIVPIGHSTSAAAIHSGYSGSSGQSGALPGSFGTPSSTGGVPNALVHAA